MARGIGPGEVARTRPEEARPMSTVDRQSANMLKLQINMTK